MNTSKKILATALVFTVLILINVVGDFFPTRIDLTEDKIYTLSDGSKSLLQKIEEPIDFEFYFSRSAELPANLGSLKNYADRIEEMLQQYAHASNGMIRLKIIDPKPFTDEEEQANLAGIHRELLPNQEQLYLGLAVIQADQQKNISFFDPRREQFLENDISKIIHSVQQWEKPKLGIYSSLPIFERQPPPQMMMMQQPQQQGQPDWITVQQWRLYFDIVELQSPEDFEQELDILAVIHPTSVVPQIEYAIDQFVLSGRPTVLVMDPSSFVSRVRQQAPAYMPTPTSSSNLPALFNHYGITFNTEKVIGDKELSLEVPYMSNTPTLVPSFLELKSYCFNKDYIPSAELNNMWLIESGSFDLAEDSPLKLTPIIQSSVTAGELDTTTLANMTPGKMIQELTPQGEAFTLAGMLTGELTTAFPEGLPPLGDQEEGEAEKAPIKPDLLESAGDVNLVFIADSDWLYDNFSVRVFNIFGNTQASPLNDNLAFASNLIDFLSGSEDLISIRTKGNALRPFERVDKIKLKAQEQYQDSLKKLDEEIAEVQEKLQEFEVSQDTEGRLLLSPEAEKAITELRATETKLRKEQREIAKKSTEDIEALERDLLLGNMLIVPLFIALFGITFFLKRSRNK